MMRPLSLRRRFLLYVLLPLIAFSGGLGVLALRQFESIVRSRMELDVRVVARTFQPALVRLMEDEERERLQPLLGQAFEAEGDYGVFVYDPEGELVARAGRFEDRGGDFRDGNFDRESRGGGYSEVAGESVYSYFAPLVTERGDILGILQVARLRRDYERFLDNLRLGGLVFFILGAVTLVGVVALGYQRAIGASLEGLNASMQRIKRGDRDHRASPGGAREVVGLGETLNDMLGSIERAEAEILRRQKKERRLAERLKESEKLASLGNIAAGVAHELGGPLSVVVGNARRGLRQEGNPPKTVEALNGIRAEVDRMDRIVRELLEFGRAGGTDAKPVAPERLAHAALSAVENLRRELGGEIVVERGFAGGKVWVNPVRVELALGNLLKNALQARPGGVVRFSWLDTAAGAVFEVSDEGPGIEESARERIFEPFFTTKGPDRGVGLGLAIVSQVADECGGDVRVVPGEGPGARFRLRIPFHEEES